VDELRIVTVVALVVVAIVLFWQSLLMASLESAIVRVTRANLNNLMIEAQTDSELSQFTRQKKIAKIHRVQHLVANRHATSSACAFLRILSNVLIGACVVCIAAIFASPVWLQLIYGVLAALVVAFVSVLARPRSVGSDKPLEILLAYSHLASFAYACAPFLHPRKSKSARKTELSENEELEEIHLEQGRAAINRVLETNRFDPEVSEMLHNVLALSDSLTREIMVPRTDMICIEKDDTLEDFLKLCSRSGYSRIPVIGNDIDDLLGIAYMKDAVRATIFNNAALSRPIESIMRKPMLVPELKPADDLFHEMQQTCHHVAVVVDEYGGIAGMVTIEDALEQIVGELQDEHDHTQHGEPRQIGEHKWSMPARTPIAELEDIFEIDLDEDDVDTVYGLLTKLLGRVPIVGSSAVTRGLRLTAVDSAGRRKKVSTIVVEPESDVDQTTLESDADSPDSNSTKKEQD